MAQHGSGSQFPCLVAKLSLAALIYHVCACGWVGDRIGGSFSIMA